MALVRKNYWKQWVLFLIGQVLLIIIYLKWLGLKLWSRIKKINPVGICIQKLKFLGFQAEISNLKVKILHLLRIIHQKKIKISLTYIFLLVDSLDSWFHQVFPKYRNKFLTNIQILMKDYQVKIIKVTTLIKLVLDMVLNMILQIKSILVRFPGQNMIIMKLIQYLI